MSILTTVGAAAVSGIWKVAAIAAMLIAAGAGGGWAWSAHDLRKVTAENVKMASTLHDQNIAIAALGAATAEANRKREAAEKAAMPAIAKAAVRVTAVTASAAPDCAGVLNEAWEAWK